MAGIVDALALKLREKICHHRDAHAWWLEMEDMVDQIVDENTKLHKENKQLQSMIDKFIEKGKNFQLSYQEIKGMADEAVEKSKKLQDENMKQQDMIDKGIVEEKKNFQHEIKEREASLQEKLETMKNMFEESKREHQEIVVKVDALVEENKTLRDIIAQRNEEVESEAMHTQPFRYTQPFRLFYSRRKQQPTKPAKRKARSKGPQVIMDNQIMIPGNIYQSWLKDPSSLTSERRRVSSKINLIQAIKIGDLMDLPPVALMSCSENSPLELYYPQQLMQLWKECTKVKSPKPSSSGDFEECSCSLLPVGSTVLGSCKRKRTGVWQEAPHCSSGQSQVNGSVAPLDFSGA